MSRAGPRAARQSSFFHWTRLNGYVNISEWQWTIRYYDDELQQRIMMFPDGIQARYIHLTERMLIFGPDLGMPQTRSMGQGLFEMRMKSKEGIGRMFFCTLPGRQIIMLHAFIKKSAKTPARDLKIARARQKEVKENADT
jgi:phage-related protein